MKNTTRRALLALGGSAFLTAVAVPSAMAADYIGRYNERWICNFSWFSSLCG